MTRRHYRSKGKAGQAPVDPLAGLSNMALRAVISNLQDAFQGLAEEKSKRIRQLITIPQYSTRLEAPTVVGPSNARQVQSPVLKEEILDRRSVHGKETQFNQRISTTTSSRPHPAQQLLNWQVSSAQTQLTSNTSQQTQARAFNFTKVEDVYLQVVQPEVRQSQLEHLQNLRPQMQQPQRQKPQPLLPQLLLPQVKQSQVNQPQVKQPQVKQTQVKQTQVKQSQAKQPQVKQAQLKQPQLKHSLLNQTHGGRHQIDSSIETSSQAKLALSDPFQKVRTPNMQNTTQQNPLRWTEKGSPNQQQAWSRDSPVLAPNSVVLQHLQAPPVQHSHSKGQGNLPVTAQRADRDIPASSKTPMKQARHQPTNLVTPAPQVPAVMRRVPKSTDVVRSRAPLYALGHLNNTMFGRGSAYPGPVVKNAESWTTWPELSIRVRGLPFNISTRELDDIFSREGSIESIEIFLLRGHQRDGTARVRFRPPPLRAFWTSGIYRGLEQAGEPGLELRVELTDLSRSWTITSPSNPKLKLPEQTNLEIRKIGFGLMHDPITMMVMHAVTAEDDIRIDLELNLRRRFIQVQFNLPVIDPRDPTAEMPRSREPLQEPSDQERQLLGALNRVEKYRFRIALDRLTELLIFRTDGQIVMTINLDSPPTFWRKAVGSQLASSHEDDGNSWKEWKTWFRSTDIIYDPKEVHHADVALKKPQPLIDIGRWTTYRLAIEESPANQRAFAQFQKSLFEYNILLKDASQSSGVIAPGGPTVWDWIDKPSRVLGEEPTSFWVDWKEASVPALPFSIRYQLEVCISQGCLNEHNMSKAFVAKLAAMEERVAKDLLEYVAQKKARVWNPMSIFDLKVTRGSASRARIPHYCAYTRKATVTPSMIYYGTPQVEISNRVVRQYIEHADRFLRVQFTDEKFEGRIYSSEDGTGKAVLTRIQRTMMNGITIGDRHFEFLAFGNSQFRENGAYFFSPTPFLSAADIRRWMGDFSSIRVPAKYAARLGQCFSTTRAINGTRVEIRETSDVKKKHVDAAGITSEYNFTDGVGKISEFLAKMVASELNLPFVPSVLQFRLGGCKGVLTLWPDAKDREIHLRPSQYKFPAVHNGLEINRWSQFSVATLNRQIIILLSALGVPDEVFSRKLQLMMTHLSRAMYDKEVAVPLLEKYIDPNHMTVTVAGLILDGFMDVEEPFLMSVMQLWRAWSIKCLKEKAKIYIEQGAFLLGCTDETRTLKGHFDRFQVGPAATMEQRLQSLPEIFIQVPSKANPKLYTVVEGLCVFARNPSLHPGDIRVVRAVDRPGLRHLRDVVVLPQTGDRDLAGMCSGGDLDGDDYLVIWDSDLLPSDWNQPPMDYTPPKPKSLDRPVTNSDIINFFVNFMNNDRLGTIASAHLANADHLERGVRDEKCLELAALHSQAVDYVKSGEAAFISEQLRPGRYPHFMYNPRRAKEKIYTSSKVLGQLYDQVERVKFVPTYSHAFDERVLRAYPLDAPILRAAREVKDAYDAEMRRTMAHYEIETEFEVWSTFVMNYSSSTNDYKFHEEMGQIASALKETFRQMCIERAGGKEMEKLGPFAAAMYTVTQQEISEAVAKTRERKIVGGREVRVQELDPSKMPLMSFPWCLHDVLGKVANERGTAAGTEKAMNWQAQKEGSKMEDPSVARARMEEDVVETTEGVTHRGDLLKLFPHKGIDSEEEMENEPKGVEDETMVSVTRTGLSGATTPDMFIGHEGPAAPNANRGPTADKAVVEIDLMGDLIGLNSPPPSPSRSTRDDRACSAKNALGASILDIDHTAERIQGLDMMEWRGDTREELPMGGELYNSSTRTSNPSGPVAAVHCASEVLVDLEDGSNQPAPMSDSELDQTSWASRMAPQQPTELWGTFGSSGEHFSALTDEQTPDLSSVSGSSAANISKGALIGASNKAINDGASTDYLMSLETFLRTSSPLVAEKRSTAVIERARGSDFDPKAQPFLSMDISRVAQTQDLPIDSSNEEVESEDEVVFLDDIVKESPLEALEKLISDDRCIR